MTLLVLCRWSLVTPSPTTCHGARKLLVDVGSAGKRLLAGGWWLVAVGEFGLIVRSDDQGASWVQSPSPTSVMLTAVSFADDPNGWAMGHDGVILATSDCGASWAMQFNGKQGDPQMLRSRRDATRESCIRLNETTGEATWQSSTSMTTTLTLSWPR